VQKKNQLSKVVQEKSEPHNVIKPTKKKIQVLKNEIAHIWIQMVTFPILQKRKST